LPNDLRAVISIVVTPQFFESSYEFERMKRSKRSCRSIDSSHFEQSSPLEEIQSACDDFHKDDLKAALKFHR
jgi:hypothetical protein